MATIQVLKKKLRGIRSIQKISKALKTASTVKFSRMNGALADYRKYSEQCRLLYERNRGAYDVAFAPANPDAPPCLVVMASNKGMCGTFNSELLSFAEELLGNECAGWPVLLCGKRTESWFAEKKLPFERAFVFGDVPRYEDARALFETICAWLREGKISAVKVVYPRYSNMMKQTPVLCDLLGGAEEKAGGGEMLFFPDRESVVQNTAEMLLASFLFEKLLECALGAQAATLMTMRSAYDTAVEYGLQLEGEINRKRQSQVTADVIETSSERPQEVS